MTESIQVGVIGLGRFGLEFAKTLISFGKEVIGIDIDRQKVKNSRMILQHVYEADAMNKEALVQIGIPDATHAVVSLGKSITASLMTCMFLKELGIGSVWAKATDTDHAKLLEKVGVERVLLPEAIVARQHACQLAVPGFLEYLPFGEAIVLRELNVNRFSGKTLRQIDLSNRYGVQVIAIKKAVHGEYRFTSKADEPLETGDVLMAIGEMKEIKRISP
jgi:trk system potassium uptake protein TrkA